MKSHYSVIKMSKSRVREIIKEIFELQKELRDIAPRFRWRGLGNLLGDYGEFIGLELYDLDPTPSGTKDHDALTKDGKSVQIKTNRWASQIGFRGISDFLLVLHVHDNAEVEEVYYGLAEPVLKASRYSERDNKHMIAISKLKDLATSAKQKALPLK